MKVNAMEEKGGVCLRRYGVIRLGGEKAWVLWELLALVGQSRSECHEDVEEFRVQACVDKHS